MYATETLIRAVQKQPPLWDVRNVNYYSREVKEQAWTEVCKKVYKRWDKLNAIEHLIRCNEIKKKWSHVRDYYRKSLIKRSAKKIPGVKVKQMKIYTYASMLHFLDPVINNKRKTPNAKLTDDNTDEVDSSENTIEEFDNLEIDNEVKEEKSEDVSSPSKTSHKGQFLSICEKNIKQEIENKTSPASDDEDEISLINIVKSRETNKIKTNDATQLNVSDSTSSSQGLLKGPFLTICNNNIKQEIELDPAPTVPSFDDEVSSINMTRPISTTQMKSSDEDDINFLLSFRSDMRNMSPGQKLDFKLGMVQLMKKILTSEFNE